MKVVVTFRPSVVVKVVEPTPAKIYLRTGKPGPPGPPGEPGQDGAPGKSAYEIAVDNGYEGTVTEWLNDMIRHGGNARGTNLSIGTNDNYTLIFKANNSDHAYLFANGNFSLGNPSNAGYKLDVNGTSLFRSTLMVNTGAINATVGISGSDTSINSIGTALYSGNLARWRLAMVADRHLNIQRAISGNFTGNPSIRVNFDTGNVSFNAITDTGDTVFINGGLRVTNIGIGTSVSPTARVVTAGTIAGGASALGHYINGTFGNDVTAAGTGMRVHVAPAANTIVTQVAHFWASAPTYGAGSSVNRSIGFLVDDSVNQAGATNIYGFRGQISAGTSRYNLFLDGTADNYLFAKTGIGHNNPGLFYANKLVVQADGGVDDGITIYNPSATGSNMLAFADGTTSNARYRGFVAYLHASDELRLGSAGAAQAYLFSNGNFSLGNATNAGFKLDVVGGARVSENMTLGVQNSGVGSTLTIHTTTGNPTFILDGVQGTIRARSGYTAWIPYDPANAGMYFNMAHNTVGFYRWSKGATNTMTSTNQLMYLSRLGQLLLDDSTPTGNSTPSAGAILELKSTTRLLVPPVMTGAQAEAIATKPESGLCYVNNGNGATITSAGWWGWNGTTWEKLN